MPIAEKIPPKNYGVWAGPSYAGGQMLSAARNNDDPATFARLFSSSGGVKPVGYLDAAARLHDMAYEYATRMYGASGVAPNAKAQQNTQFLADLDLMANALRYRPAADDFIGRHYRDMLISAFYYVVVRDYKMGAHMGRIWNDLRRPAFGEVRRIIGGPFPGKRIARRWYKTVQALAVSLTMLLSIPARAGDILRWTEEVKLSDGSVIQLQRRAELTESGFPVQGRGFVKWQEFCYAPLQIYWKSRGGPRPDIFDIVDNKAYLHVPISGCHVCEKNGYPKTDALYYVWEDDHWRQIDHAAFPVRSEWNLLLNLVGKESDDDARGLITIQEKNETRDLNHKLEQKRFGWKRISESYSHKGACGECRGVRNHTSGDVPSSFIQQRKSICQ